MDPIRVVIADDHTLVREGIRALLAREGDLEVVAEAADGAQALKLVEKFKPNILLLDPSLLRGPQALQTVRDKSPGTEILILTESPPGGGPGRRARTSAAVGSPSEPPPSPPGPPRRS